MSDIHTIDVHVGFSGCCGNPDCLTESAFDGSLRFGTGKFDHENNSWSTRCKTCDEAWKDENRGYMFDIAVMLQSLHVAMANGRRLNRVDFTPDDIAELAKHTLPIRAALMPFSPFIRKAVSFISMLADTVTKVDELAEQQQKRLLK